MASCNQGMTGEGVISSGVRMMPPFVHSATKKKPQAARIRTSVLSRSPLVTRSSAACSAAPITLHLDEIAGEQAQHRSHGQHFEIGTEHVFEATRLSGDIVGAEPFDMSARFASKSESGLRRIAPRSTAAASFDEYTLLNPASNAGANYSNFN